VNWFSFLSRKFIKKKKLNSNSN